MMKQLRSMLEMFGLTGDSFDALLSKELEHPSVHDGVLSFNPAISELGQGEPTSDQGREILADSAMYQEQKYAI